MGRDLSSPPKTGMSPSFEETSTPFISRGSFFFPPRETPPFSAHPPSKSRGAPFRFYLNRPLFPPSFVSSFATLSFFPLEIVGNHACPPEFFFSFFFEFSFYSFFFLIPAKPRFFFSAIRRLGVSKLLFLTPRASRRILPPLPPAVLKGGR